MSSLKADLINKIKYSKALYSLYYGIMNSFMNVIKHFVKTENDLILFNSYAGRKFDDSPKAIYEVLRKDLRFKDHRLVWAFHRPENIADFPKDSEKIRTDSFRYL